MDLRDRSLLAQKGKEKGTHMAEQKNRKPDWVVAKERAKKASAAETIWLFGLHAVRDALANPAREKLRLVVTQNALDRLGDTAGMEPEITDARVFDKVVGLPPDSVHQGCALEARPLGWGSLVDVAISGEGLPLVVALDRVTDPHNVGAVLRSAEVFGARAVIAPRHHSAPAPSSRPPAMPHPKPARLRRPHRGRWNASPICVSAIWPTRWNSLRRRVL